MAGLESGVTAKDLAYVRRRYISSVDMLRRAIAIVADGTLRARNPAIWGTATTAWSGRGMIEQIGGELRRQAHHVDRNPRPGQRACVRLDQDLGT